MNNIFVIGVGLIGGSLCLDIKKIYPKVKVYGIDTSSENLDLALNLDLIDYKSSLDVLYKADLILITKTDLLPYIEYDIQAEKKEARKLKPNVDILEVNIKDDDSIKRVLEWIEIKRMQDEKKS